MGRAGESAEVGGQKIGGEEFSEALRQQQDRLRGMLGRNSDASLLDSPGDAARSARGNDLSAAADDARRRATT